MTGCGDEVKFHNAIYFNRNDRVAKLVFADWLQDRDDPRAEGYRVMGEYDRNAFPSTIRDTRTHFWYDMASADQPGFGGDWCASDPSSDLPPPWFDALPGTVTQVGQGGRLRGVGFATHVEAYDAAALAWGRLSAAMRRHCRELIEDYVRRRATGTTYVPGPNPPKRT